MDLQFGHGFIPRIGSENYKAVDRCLGPGDLWSAPLDLPWALVDGAWAEKDPTVLGALRDQGTKLIVDTSGWRYRYEATFAVAKMAETSWAPSAPIEVDAVGGLETFVRTSLRAQAALGADVYLVPGLLPSSADEDLRAVYETIVRVAAEFSDVPAKPLVLFVGAHSRGIDHGMRLIEELPGFLSGLYCQVSPLSMVRDSPTKLEQVTNLYRRAVALGIPVIAGHGGAVTPALRAIGVSAADAGLATDESFDMSTKRRPKRKAEPGEKRSGGPTSRMYLREIGRSLDATTIRSLLAVDGARAELSSCRLPCHRFIGGDPLARAKEHSLWARVAEAAAIHDLPSSMRPSAVADLLAARRSTLTTINGALAAAEVDLLDTRPIDNHLNWFSRLMEHRSAA